MFCRISIIKSSLLWIILLWCNYSMPWITWTKHQRSHTTQISWESECGASINGRTFAFIIARIKGKEAIKEVYSETVHGWKLLNVSQHSPSDRVLNTPLNLQINKTDNIQVFLRKQPASGAVTKAFVRKVRIKMLSTCRNFSLAPVSEKCLGYS